MEITTVKLESHELECVQSFEIEHAQRILNYLALKGRNSWVLNDDKFELKDGIITQRNTASSKKTKEYGLVIESDLPSEQA